MAPAGALAAVVVCYLARGTVLEKILTQLHAANAQGGENPLLHNLVVRFPRDGLDNAAQNAIAKVRIGIVRARIEIQGLAHRVADDLLGVNRQRDAKGLGDLFSSLGRHRVERFVAVPAARVLQAMPHGNIVPTRVEAGLFFKMRLKLQKRKHPFVKAKFALFDELHHGCRGKGFAQAGDAKQRSGPHRLAHFDVGVAETPGVDKATVIADGQGRAGRFVLAHEGSHQLVIGRQLGHNGPGDLAEGPLASLPEGQTGGGRSQEPAARRTRQRRIGSG